MGVHTRREGQILGPNPSQNMQLQIAQRHLAKEMMRCVDWWERFHLLQNYSGLVNFLAVWRVCSNSTEWSAHSMSSLSDDETQHTVLSNANTADLHCCLRPLDDLGPHPPPPYGPPRDIGGRPRGRDMSDAAARSWRSWLIVSRQPPSPTHRDMTTINYHHDVTPTHHDNWQPPSPTHHDMTPTHHHLHMTWQLTTTITYTPRHDTYTPYHDTYTPSPTHHDMTPTHRDMIVTCHYMIPTHHDMTPTHRVTVTTDDHRHLHTVTWQLSTTIMT